MSRIFLALVLAGTSLLAAVPEPEPIEAQLAAVIQLMRSDLQANTRAALAANLEMSAAEAAAFWPLYDDYQLAYTKLADIRLMAIKQFTDNYEHLTPALTEAIADKVFTYQMKRVKLAKSTFRKVAKAVSPEVAARFLQIDTAIRSAVDLRIQAELPLFK